MDTEEGGVQLGEVVGTLVSTRKDPKMVGMRFLVVKNLDADMRALGSYSIAVDTVGAGVGDVVLHVGGSSARMTEATNERPADACIMAIVDAIEIDGRYTYEKARKDTPTA
jgi:ethanolamine utilization protein EutN/carbon dioxide concentrating mechanism protein CcmL